MDLRNVHSGVDFQMTSRIQIPMHTATEPVISKYFQLLRRRGKAESNEEIVKEAKC